MQVHFGVDLVEAEWEGSVVCLGTFDGVHRGHQGVIATAVAQAETRERPCILVTFDRHPAAVIDPARKPPAIRSLASNLDLIRRQGVALTVVLPFTHELSQTSADRFLRQFLIGKLKAESVVVGHDFGFGRNREGDVDWLRKRIDMVAVPPVLLEGVRVSSSLIREAVQEGNLTNANEWLGDPFAIEGVVVGGQRLGRTLGYPTVNLARSFEQVVPGDGIYAGLAHTPHGKFLAAISIGMRPTVEGKHRTIEAYLLDYPGISLYGKPLHLEVHRFLRGEVRFDGLEALKEQMAADVLEVRDVMQSIWNAGSGSSRSLAC